MTALTVILPSDIIYVAGYINGIQTVFIQDTFNPLRWRADADVAEDGLYHMELEMHDEAGNIGHYEETIEYILPVFVYDRCQSDVDRALKLQKTGWNHMSPEQQAQWKKGLKGCLNLSDLKRIENNIHVIAGLLKVSLQTNKDNLPEIPSDLYFSRLLENVETLRNTGYIRQDTPKTPKQPLNTFGKVNDVERILHDVYEVHWMNNGRFSYAGKEAYAGEDVGIL